MLRHQLSNLSRITSSTLRYAVAAPASLLTWSLQENGPPSPQLVEFWITETERGLDALLNDQFDVAETIFVQHCSVSPFHAVGYALMAYLEAMLMLDSGKIQVAAQRIHAAEELVKQLQKRSRRRGWWGYRSSSSSASTHSSTQSDHQSEGGPVSISFSSQQIKEENDEDDSASSITTVMTAPEEPLDEPKQQDDPLPKTPVLPVQTLSLQCDVLEVNCMLMSATIQFLKSSWFEYMKGAYKLRKAYKMYEQLFEILTNCKTNDYAADLRKRRSYETESFGSSAASWESDETSSNSTMRKSGGKRFSLFSLASSRRASVDSLKASWSSRRSFSIYDRRMSVDNEPCVDSMVESGVYFGIGLFSLIFSLLPPKVNKVLNTLGFHSSRPFALHILQKSYMSNGLYSSLSALSLLVYYTNLSLFIHPQLLPSSLTLNAARHMLNHMKSKFPGNKLWELLEGKLCKMEGKTRRGVEIIRDTRRRHSVKVVDLVNAAEPVHTHGSKKKTGFSASTTPIDDKYHQQHTRRSNVVISEMAQLQALAVYEMGWGQIFLGDYFQASETFFQLESMSNWSRAFYHYIATCCMFADEQYDKAGMEFHQIPNILERKRQLGGMLLPNELFAERKIKRWKEKAQQLLDEDTASAASYIPEQQRRQQEMIKKRYSLLDGQLLQQVIVVNPLWELIYLWNGIPYLSKEMLVMMKKQLEQAAQRHKDDKELVVLKLLLGSVSRETADYAFSEKCFKYVINIDPQEDRWTVPYAMYEMGTLCALQNRIVEARKWIHRSQQYTHQNHQRTDNTQHSSSSSSNSNSSSNDTPSEHGDYNDLESRLHIRCQVLLEKLDELDKK